VIHELKFKEQHYSSSKDNTETSPWGTALIIFRSPDNTKCIKNFSIRSCTHQMISILRIPCKSVTQDKR